jgi:hypothetical protein
MAAIVLCSCAAKKKIVVPPEEMAPVWQTVQVTNTLLAIEVDGQTYNVTCQMQAVRDSMIVVSVMPVLNMELLRLEITPEEALVIDKMNHRYTRLELAKAQSSVLPALRWDDLQRVASGSGGAQAGETMSLGYNFRGHSLQLKVTFGTIAYDAPVHLRRLKLNNYEFVDIMALLQ